MRHSTVPGINYGRIALGGLAASLSLVLGEGAVVGALSSRLLAAREAAKLPSVEPQLLLAVIEIGLTGFLTVWVYAAIRPRFGAGAVTAIRSALAVWVAAPLLMTIHMIYDGFGFPAPLLLTLAVGVLPVFVLARLVGAWVYRE